MIIGLLPVSVSAAGTAEISFTTTFEDGMTVGDTFTVTASLANNPGVASVMLTLDWNSDAVQFTGFDKYEDDFPVSEVLEARGWTAVANHTLGIITASRTADNTSNGTLFTANFKIVGSGDLNISLLDSETETTFMMNNATYEELDVTIDYSAIEGLTVAGGDEGAAIPEGAPFTAITTDAGNVLAIEEQEAVDFTGYSSFSGVPYYHVQIPEGATEIYVTHPDSVDPFCDASYNSAYGYYADTATWTGGGLTFAYEAVDGGYIITIPTVSEMDSDWDGTPDTEIAFVADEEGNISHAVAVEKTADNNYDPICFFTFEYAVEEVDDSFQMVTSDGQDVIVTYVGEEPNYGMGSLYKVEVPLGTTQVNVTYNDGIVEDNGFGYARTHMIGFAGVSDDGYGMSSSNGKTTVALSMVKAPANMAPELMKLLNIPYGENPRTVGIYKNDETLDYFAFTYILEEGQHFAALPEGTGYTASGSPIASDGYTFSVTLLEGYEATADFAIKVNGETVATVPGDVTVASVTEDLIITVEGVAKIVEATDISVTLDLTGYTGTFDGYLGYTDRNYNSDEVDLQVGKSNTLALKAADNGGFYAQVYEISPLVTGWMINDTAYYYPNEYATYSLADGVQMSMNPADGYFSVDITSTNPYIAVIKPIVATAESVGAAPDFAEDCIDVTDISVLGADVVSSAWDGDTLNVVLAADTAADATIKTLWTIPVKNSNEGAGNAMFNINGRLQTPGPNMTYTWADNLTLAEGVANKTYAFEAANTPWDPNSALTFTSKTFTLNFSIASSEPEQPTSNPITEIEISHPNIVTDDEGNMTMAMVTGASEQIDVSTVLANADLDATQDVAWSSSVPEVASVENGKVTALKAGTTVITAKAVDESPIALLADGEEVLAQFTLTVSDPADGYAVNMGEDKTVVANETVQIPVTVTHSDSNVTDYKSFEFTFQYDPALLTLVTGSSEDNQKEITVVDNNGTVTVRRYGDALDVGDAAITLEFTAKAVGNTNVKLITAKVGTSDDAKDENIPTAQIEDNLTKITVSGYTVKLPDEFEGKTVVAPGEDYTFTAKDLNYEYTITATIGGQPLTVTGSGTDTDPYKITADQITGNIEITTEKSGKKFEITLNGTSLAHNSGHTVVDGKTYAQYMTPYTAKLTKKDHYIYDLKVTVNGETIAHDYNNETGIITIAGNLITGPVVIDSGEQESDKHDVTFEGTYASHAKYEGESAVYDGENFSFTIETPEGFTIQSYEVSYKLGDAEEYTTLEANNGTYTIENITAALTIKIEGTSDLKVEVNEYVKLDGKVVFLVTATQTLPEGKNLAYNSYPMYLKNFQVEGSDTMEQMYSYLVVVNSGETLSVEDATAMITIVEAQATTLEDTFNVNESTALDINDAQLVYDLYNNVYQDITTVGMQKFLRADVNGSRNINVSDAAAVVNAILAENQ